MPFLNELVIKPANDDQWELTEPLVYFHYTHGEVYVPAGFQMDLASIPRVFTWLFPVHGKHTRAAVVHDWLYANKGVLPHKTYRRVDADQIFLDAMEELGVGRIKRSILYRAVRIGGWFFWNELDERT